VRFGWPIVVALVAARTLAAHPLSPALLALVEHEGGAVDVEWKVPIARVPGTAPAPVLPPRCRDATPHESVSDGVGVRTSWRVECGEGSLVGERVGVHDPGPAGAVVRVVLRDGRVAQRLVLPPDVMFTIPAAERPWDLMRAYARLGIEHILTGPDHLLFVFGLVLLAGSFRRIAATVTAFTLGHSLTLALAVLGVVALPQAPIEMAIAASVFLLAVELARDPATPSFVRRQPWIMAALFGLLHGLGFAAALTDAGLPSTDVPLALFAFNVGIEAGQIGFVASVLALRALVAPVLRRLPAWSDRVPVYAMGSLAAYWWIERTMILLR
jgi:hydrogenase/urease accessory protein HupE